MKYLKQYPTDLGNEKSWRLMQDSKPFHPAVDINLVVLLNIVA